MFFSGKRMSKMKILARLYDYYGSLETEFKSAYDLWLKLCIKQKESVKRLLIYYDFCQIMDMTNEYFLAFSRKKNAAIVGQGRQLKNIIVLVQLKKSVCKILKSLGAGEWRPMASNYHSHCFHFVDSCFVCSRVI